MLSTPVLDLAEALCELTPIIATFWRPATTATDTETQPSKEKGEEKQQNALYLSRNQVLRVGQYSI
jgi:hypothetical protein